MKAAVFAAALILLGSVAPVRAHRLDELLQAALLTVGKDRVTVQLCLTPGADVFRRVRADLDADGDGVISAGEQRAYAERVLRDLSLAVDGASLSLRLVSWTFPSLEEMQMGQGGILLGLEANVPRGGPRRRLIFENRYQSDISVYLANCLVPSDPALHVGAQTRNDDQSWYQLDYTQPGFPSGQPSFTFGKTSFDRCIAGALALLAGLTFWRWGGKRFGIRLRRVKFHRRRSEANLVLLVGMIFAADRLVVEQKWYNSNEKFASAQDGFPTDFSRCREACGRPAREFRIGT